MYKNLLSQFKVKDCLIPVICKELSSYYHEVSKSAVEQEASLKLQLSEVSKKIDSIEETYYALGEMSKDTFNKFNSRFQEVRLRINKLLADCQNSISTLDNDVYNSVQFASKLATIWDLSNIETKEILQKLIFPEGVLYDRENEAVRPIKTNFIFELILRQLNDTDENKKGDKHLFDDLSPSAEKYDFE